MHSGDRILTAAFLLVLVVLSGAVTMSIAHCVLGDAGAVVALEGHVYVTLPCNKEQCVPPQRYDTA